MQQINSLTLILLGNSGYLYQLTWIPNEERVYLATLITTMHLPTDPTMLDDAVELMKALFMFKVYNEWYNLMLVVLNVTC